MAQLRNPTDTSSRLLISTWVGTLAGIALCPSLSFHLSRSLPKRPQYSYLPTTKIMLITLETSSAIMIAEQICTNQYCRHSVSAKLLNNRCRSRLCKSSRWGCKHTAEARPPLLHAPALPAHAFLLHELLCGWPPILSGWCSSGTLCSLCVLPGSCLRKWAYILSCHFVRVATMIVNDPMQNDAKAACDLFWPFFLAINQKIHLTLVLRLAADYSAMKVSNPMSAWWQAWAVFVVL